MNPIDSRHDLDQSNTSINSAADSARRKITIYVATLTGKTVSLEVWHTDTILHVKCRIWEDEGIAVESQQLVFRDQLLRDPCGLDSYGIIDGSTIRLVLKMSGGISLTKPKEEQVLIFVCKKNDEMFMIQLDMDDPDTRQQATDQLLRLAGDTNGSSGDFFGSGHSLAARSLPYSSGDLSSRTGTASVHSGSGSSRSMTAEESSTSHKGGDSVKNDTREKRANSQQEKERKSSATSIISDVMSINPSLISVIRETAGVTTDLAPQDIQEFLALSLGQGQDDTDAILGAEDCPVVDRPEAYANLQRFNSDNDVYKTRSSDYPSTPKANIRPSTAISIMRIKKNQGKVDTSMFVLPKSRPTSASIKPPTFFSEFDIQSGNAFDQGTKASSIGSKGVSAPDLRGNPSKLFPKRSRVVLGNNKKSPHVSKESLTPVKHSSLMSTSQGSKISFDFETHEDGVGDLYPKNTAPSPSTSSNPVHPASTPPIGKRISSKPYTFKSTSKPIVLPKRKANEREIKTRTGIRTPRKEPNPPLLPALPPKSTFIVTSQANPIKRLPYQCDHCQKKLRQATCFKCKCEGNYCSFHRYSDRHDCHYNYREGARVVLVKENPLVVPDKISDRL